MKGKNKFGLVVGLAVVLVLIITMNTKLQQAAVDDRELSKAVFYVA